MGIAALAGGGWLSASQSFVTLGKDDQLVHPSPIGWPLLVCGIAFLLAAYAYVSTYWLWLLPARVRPVDHSAMYGLAMIGFSPTLAVPKDDPAAFILKLGVMFYNASPVVISYEVERMTVSIAGEEQDPGAAQWLTTGGRLLPGHGRAFNYHPLSVSPRSEEYVGEMYYRASYGPISGSPRYRKTHRFEFNLFGISPPETLGGNEWWDIESEQDVVAS
jgi:hypothetical protein